jgi:hypothetical protein
MDKIERIFRLDENRPEILVSPVEKSRRSFFPNRYKRNSHGKHGKEAL